MTQPTEPLFIETWDEETFRNSRSEWDDLLKRSSCDQLFLSWEWLFPWWETFSDRDSMQLYILAARNAAGTLIGVAPLYIHEIKVKGLISSRILQFIGNCWRGRSTMRTELMEFIMDDSCSQFAAMQFYKSIFKDKKWDELTLSNLLVNSDTYNFLENIIRKNNYYIRKPEFYFSYYVSNINSYKDYLAKLGKNTRLKLHNRRKILENIEGTSYIPNNNRTIKENFELLNAFHLKRWGKPAFENEFLRYNLNISELFNQKNALKFSEIKSNGEPISLQYNFHINNKIYNIQSGYQENYHKKLALGYLHFGYEIEDIFNKNIKYYDFLAGDGKNTNYKASLTTQKTELINIQIIRNKKLQIVYQLYDYINKIKSRIFRTA